MSRIEQPKTIEVVGPMDGTRTTHPAFAQISASRVSGSANLYDSDFSHQNFMTITIRKSELHRSLSNDWHVAKDELIQVALSEAQWATFVSSPNNGSGVPCTLNHFQGMPVPELPPPSDSREQFKQEMNETVLQIQSELNSLVGSLGEPLGKTKVAALRKQLDSLAYQLTGSTQFVASQFDEHIERTVEKAKVEVNAYVTNVIHRTGIDAIKSSAPILLNKTESEQ
jgi:hypothetical protein